MAAPTAAADEKHKRYGPQVTPIAFSTYVRLGREGRNAMEALAAEARWNSDDPSNQRSQVAKWRNTLEQSLLHAQADVLLLTLGAEGCAGWQKRAIEESGVAESLGVSHTGDSPRGSFSPQNAAFSDSVQLDVEFRWR